MKIHFTNGSEIAYEECIAAPEYYQGAQRDTLTFTIDPAHGVDAVNALLTAENLASFTLVNEDEGVTNAYEGYSLKVSCGLERQLISPETSSAAAVYGDKLVVKLAQKTFIERRLEQLGLL